MFYTPKPRVISADEEYKHIKQNYEGSKNKYFLYYFVAMQV